MNWDWIIGVLIIVFIILIVWSRIEHKSIVEVLEEIKDFFGDFKDNKINAMEITE